MPTISSILVLLTALSAVTIGIDKAPSLAVPLAATLLLAMVATKGKWRAVTGLLLALAIGQSSWFGAVETLWEQARLPLPWETGPTSLAYPLLPLWHLRHLAPLLAVAMLLRVPLLRYNWRADWQAPIAFPLIWRGTEMPLRQFFTIAAINVGVACGIMLYFSGGTASPITWVSVASILLFSLGNALLEEYIWRGMVQSRLADVVSEPWAVLLAAVGFGLSHVVAGTPNGWGGGILLAAGSFLVGGMVARSKGMAPAVLWHAYMDIWMILLLG